jgi:hypothetical protein
VNSPPTSSRKRGRIPLVPSGQARKSLFTTSSSSQSRLRLLTPTANAPISKDIGSSPRRPRGHRRRRPATWSKPRHLCPADGIRPPSTREDKWRALFPEIDWNKSSSPRRENRTGQKYTLKKSLETAQAVFTSRTPSSEVRHPGGGVGGSFSLLAYHVEKVRRGPWSSRNGQYRGNPSKRRVRMMCRFPPCPCKIASRRLVHACRYGRLELVVDSCWSTT